MKTNSRKLAGAAGVFFAVVVGCTVLMWSQGASLRAWRLLGKHNIDLMRRADRIEIYRVKMGPTGSQVINGYGVIGISKRRDSAFQFRVATTILNVFNTKPYLPNGGGSDCEFDPGVAFRFIKGDETLDALVCYQCAEILVLTKPRGAWSGGFNGERKAMKQLAKEAFPNDAEIQKL